MVRLCNDAGHRACNEFPIMAQLRYAIGRTVSFAGTTEVEPEETLPSTLPSLPSNLSRFQHFATDFSTGSLSLSLSPFDSPIDSKARIELENLNFLFSLNLKFRNKIRAVRRTAGRRPPIRSFIIFRSEDRGLHPPFHTFSLPFSLPSISLPALSPALLDASLFFARRFFSANFPPRSFNPFQSATWINLSLSLCRIPFNSLFFLLRAFSMFLIFPSRIPPPLSSLRIFLSNFGPVLRTCHR